jgi:O-antigen ligase
MTPPAQTSIAKRGFADLTWESTAELVRRNGSRAAMWTLPFLLVVYLGLKGGGYDSIIRDEVGVAIWWIVLLGAAVAVLPVNSPGRTGWIGLGLLAGFGAWTGLGIAWSSDAGASVREFARVATYLGVFALVLTARKPGDMRRLVNGLGAGMAVIGVLALLSRLHPAWFAEDQTALAVGSTRNRLSYPLDYWNGLATLMAMATPLLLFMAIRGRTVLGRAFAAAAIPPVALTAFLTLSRGGAIEMAVALIVFVALAPRRLRAAPTLLIAALGSAILIVATNQRDALTNGVNSTAAHHQGNEILAMTLVVCCGVGLLQTAIALAAKHHLGPRIRFRRRTTWAAWGAIAACAAIVAVGVGLPGELSDQWQRFKEPGGPGTGVQRFDSSSGSGRYQTWSSAVDANDTDPALGIGPGTFEYWWAQHGDLTIFVRDAHSLYLETLGELGIIGFLLIVGFVGWTLGVGIARSVQRDPRRRWPYAAATASAFAFAVGAGIDWAWELSVLPIAFMVLAAGLLTPRRYRAPVLAERRLSRAGLIALGVMALIAIGPQLLGARALRDSQSAAASDDLAGALDDANNAHDLQPYAAAPDLQRALVLEQMGKPDAALAPARDATAAASRDWRTWLVRSRIEAEAGDPGGSIASYRRAKSLNPRSILFAAAETPR